MPGNLWLNLIDANFGFLASMMGNCQVIPIELGHQNPGLRPKCTGNFGKKRIVIRILLLKDVEEPVTRKIKTFVLRVINGIVHQADGRKVRDNLLYGYRLAHAEHRWMDIDEATKFLGIGHLLERWPRTLSGGEAQRVAIGRALLSGPRFLLMDEPLSSLDRARREEIMAVIERIRDELKLPILYVSHDRDEVERLADTVIPLG